MKNYPTNSPEALARILAMFMITDGEMEAHEIESMESLNVYEIIGLSRKRFIEVLTKYCDDISDEAENDGTIHLLSPQRVNEVLDVITDRSKRLLCCAIALDICKADSAISDPEMLLLRHMMQHWQLSLEDLENEFIRQ
ncbi:hypothetical protein ACFSQE_17110 [Vogesella fluminis]|uniref:Co-chaperone DjlA N-terminal domain-containing protein n=1 Tax=Vogesella fluminis TaxID=1069161 RepID=A0ABQ3H4L4_9NEIS|nr:hypothetical protein [Vogesella fluminis]GHD70274.1 hypothetical protein GCM10011419_00210 [Vogesella fluminis]